MNHWRPVVLGFLLDQFVTVLIQSVEKTDYLNSVVSIEGSTDLMGVLRITSAEIMLHE